MRMKKFKLFFKKVVDAFEFTADAYGPAHRANVYAQFPFHFFQQMIRILSLAVQLVDENNDRRMAHAANVHQLARLLFHAFHTVDHEDHAVHGGQGPVSVFRKIFVTGRIQDVDFISFIIKTHNRGSHRNSALLFNLHKIRSGCLSEFIILHGTCRLDGSAE